MALLLALGINPFVGALVVSNLAFLGALAALHSLTGLAIRRGRRDRADVDARLPAPGGLLPRWPTPRASLWRAPIAAGLAALRGRYALAGLAAAGAALSRPTGGIVVAAARRMLALQDRGAGAPAARRCSASLPSRRRRRRLPGLDGGGARLGLPALRGPARLGPRPARHRPRHGRAARDRARAGTSSPRATSPPPGRRLSATWRFLRALRLAARAAVAPRGRPALPLGGLLGGGPRRPAVERHDHLDGPLRPARLPARVAAGRLGRRATAAAPCAGAPPPWCSSSCWSLQLEIRSP